MGNEDWAVWIVGFYAVYDFTGLCFGHMITSFEVDYSTLKLYATTNPGDEQAAQVPLERWAAHLMDVGGKEG